MELEAKYILPDAACGERILNSPLVQAHRESGPREISMESAYYRDDAGLLRCGGYTLRMRRENGRGVCCLKQDVSAEGAVKTRQEWECEAQDVGEGIAGLLAMDVPESFGAAVRNAELVVDARVHFLRCAVILALGDAHAELAFDAGTFGTAQPVPFYELELEWKSGPEEPFYAFLRELEREFNLEPQTRSKYARARKVP